MLPAKKSLELENHSLLLLQLPPASFSPEILPHVRYHVGFSWVISSFVSFRLVADSAAVELNENVSHWDFPERLKSSRKPGRSLNQ